MNTYKFHQRFDGYEYTYVEAETEEEAREKVDNGSCDWESGDSDNFEITEVELVEGEEPSPTTITPTTDESNKRRITE